MKEYSKDERYRNAVQWVAQEVGSHANPPFPSTVFISESGRVKPGLPNSVFHPLTKAARIVAGFESGELGKALNVLHTNVKQMDFSSISNSSGLELLNSLRADIRQDVLFIMGEFKMSLEEAICYLDMRRAADNQS